MAVCYPLIQFVLCEFQVLRKGRKNWAASVGDLEERDEELSRFEFLGVANGNVKLAVMMAMIVEYASLLAVEEHDLDEMTKCVIV